MMMKFAGLILILATMLLAGCNSSTPVTACHATGDPATPYTAISIDSANVKEHLGHPNDIYPVPEGGCPTAPLEIVDKKITICHVTGSETNPYNEIIVDVNGLSGHDQHAGDIIPMPVGGCPTAPLAIVDKKITICHATSGETDPYVQLTVSVNGLDGHNQHTGDIIPMPVGGCPITPLVIVDKKITICHATSGENDPYNQITVSVNGLNGHNQHEDDIIPMPAAGCPKSQPPASAVDRKVTICHATNSAKNPFNQITVSINGLNGHDQHAGDIIPAPTGGCPTSKK
jgi:hypothetical protein